MLNIKLCYQDNSCRGVFSLTVTHRDLSRKPILLTNFPLLLEFVFLEGKRGPCKSVSTILIHSVKETKMGDEQVSLKSEKKEGVVMDTPDRNKNQISTPLSKFEDSPFSNFLNNLSPIMPVKTVQITQPLNSLSFASVPSVFTSPHLSSLKGSRFLRRQQLSDPSRPEFSSDDGVKVDTDEGISDVVNYSNVKETFGPKISVVEASDMPSSECSKLASELARTLNYECSSPSIIANCVIRSTCLSEVTGRSSVCVPLVQEMSEKGVLSYEVSMEGVSQTEQNKEASACDWESLISDATDVLIFDSPSDPEAFTKERDPGFRSYDFVSNGLRDSQDSSDKVGGDGNELEKHSTQPGKESGLQECLESQSMVLDSSPTNNAMAEDLSKKVDNEMISGLYRGMRRRCLVFEMVGARNKHIDESCGSSDAGSSEQKAGGNPTSEEKQLVKQKPVNESSRCILPVIGLHLNALAAASKDGKVVKHESNASGKKLLVAAGSAVNFQPLTIGQESLNKSMPVTFTKRDIVLENASQTPENTAKEDLNQSSKKRRKLEPGEGETCKRCNCKKSKCLKLYCECFAAGVYCVEPCSCQDCFNKPMHVDTVLATRKQIESRNPLAFAPKVIRSCDSALSETRDDSSKTPASARHKRGCNCKKSGCLKKYCECYQGGVGCSINCRCEGCKNAYGRKDGTDGYVDEEETVTFEKSIVDKCSQKILVQSDTEQNIDSATPATPLRFGRLPMQLPFSLKNKPPRSSLLSIGSSSGTYDQGIDRPNSVQPQPLFNKTSDTTQEDEIPEVLRVTDSPISTIKSASPNSKRVSPPHCNIGVSPGRRSSRKLILKSIPSFPSLTPNP